MREYLYFASFPLNYTKAILEVTILVKSDWDLYANEHDPAVHFGVQLKRELTSTRSDSSMNLAKKWLSECIECQSCRKNCEAPDEQTQPVAPGMTEHGRDHGEDALSKKHLTLPIERPSRLIDLMPDSAHEKLARLIEYHDGCTEYATLSYVWGPGPHPWSTTSGNVKQRMTSFDRSDLPATLADALNIAERLGLRYIWIDSLCIVQDDPVEWAKEGSKMAGIYHGSYVTIAASSSCSSRDGIFNHRSKSILDGPDMIQIDSMLGNGEQSQLYVSLDQDLRAVARCRIEYSSLATRAWTLQESYLSPRILHFTKSQLIWECDHMVLSEDNLVHDSSGRRFPLDLPNDMTKSGLMRFWYQELVQGYCDRQLSYDSDKLVAISALAKAIQSLCDDDYLAGLWRGSLIQGLLWCRPYGPGKKVRHPSWSWSSQDSQIRYYHLLKWPDQFDCQVQDVQVTGDPLNPMGSVTGGSLRLNCRIWDCQLLPRSMNKYNPDYHKGLMWDGFKSMEVDVLMDNQDHPLSGGYLLYLGHKLPFLVLAAVDLRTNTYERIGLGDSHPAFITKELEDIRKFMSERPKQVINMV